MAYIDDDKLARVVEDLTFATEADSYSSRQRITKKVIKQLADLLPKPKFRIRAVATPHNHLYPAGHIDETIINEYYTEEEAQDYIRKYHRNGFGKEVWYYYYEEIA